MRVEKLRVGMQVPFGMRMMLRIY